MALDPSRVENAKKRARAKLRDAKYHDGQAAASRAAAAQLARTWGFVIGSDDEEFLPAETTTPPGESENTTS